MKTKTIKIDDDVLAVLTRSEIGEDFLRLPNEQLERPLYDRVDKVIKAAGGKWNRGKKAHVFTQDPREVLGLAVASGEIVNRLQTYQEFFTPEPLARELCDSIIPGDRVLEPSAGIGRIAAAARDQGARVFCCELHAQNVAALRTAGFLVWEGDFLQLDPDLLRPFDRVIMNPPFSGGQEYAHVKHAVQFLRSGGTLISVMSPAVSNGQQRKDDQFREWLSEASRFWVEDLPDGSFKESGTNVNTVLLHLVK